MAHKYFPFRTAGYWPLPDFPELPPLTDPDPHGIWEAREQARHQVRPLAPPCNLLKVTFQQLKILEVGIVDGAWAGIWEQHLMVRQVNGDPDRIVTVDLAAHRSGLGPINLPIEVSLSYSEFVRVRRTSLAEIMRALSHGLGVYIPFTVATGGSAEFGLLQVGTTELPVSENLHGDSDWMMGTNTLAGSDGGLTYEVTYEVSCPPVLRFEIPYKKVIAEFMKLSPVRRKAGARIGDRTVWRILQRLGYTLVDEQGSGDERMLEIAGPGDFDAMCKALDPDKSGARKTKR